MQPFKMLVGDLVNEKQKDWLIPFRVSFAMQEAWLVIFSLSSLHS